MRDYVYCQYEQQHSRESGSGSKKTHKNTCLKLSIIFSIIQDCWSSHIILLILCIVVAVLLRCSGCRHNRFKFVSRSIIKFLSL